MAHCACGRTIPFSVLQAAFSRSTGVSCSECGYKTPPERVVKALREVLRAELAEGTDCPGCGAFAKRYNRKLNSSIARWLIELVRRSPSGQWVKGSVVTDALNNLGKDATTLLPDWGLIEGCSVCERESGLWRPTPLGRDFVMGIAEVPRTIYTYNRECLGHDERKGKVGIREALGDKFDYDELMKMV